jgi:hypothetical protein
MAMPKKSSSGLEAAQLWSNRLIRMMEENRSHFDLVMVVLYLFARPIKGPEWFLKISESSEAILFS